MKMARLFAFGLRDSACCALFICVVGASLCGCGEKESGAPPAATYFLDAQQALAKGDNAAALAALQASIDADPNSYAYMERIKINGKQGSDAAVEEDIQALVKLDPENRDIAWIRQEMKKPAAERFGPGSAPPSSRK